MISGYLSNAHARLGYTVDDDAPTMPLHITRGLNQWTAKTYRIEDADGAWLADFRNRTDARRFVDSYGIPASLAPITERDVLAALQAAHLRDTPESRKDIRRALETALGVTGAPAPRMLTFDEIDAVYEADRGNNNCFQTQADGLIHKFCEVNGIALARGVKVLEQDACTIGVTEDAHDLLRRALHGFLITQRLADYPPEHWAPRAAALLNDAPCPAGVDSVDGRKG